MEFAIIVFLKFRKRKTVAFVLLKKWIEIGLITALFVRNFMVLVIERCVKSVLKSRMLVSKERRHLLA